MASDPDLATQISRQLRTVRFGRPLQVYPLVTSTNDLARDLAASGAGEGTAVLALEQSAGRGRLGRRWASPPGGLYLSLVLRPDLRMERWPLIGLACSLGAAAAAEAHAGAPVRVKWPNDLLLDGRKVGGILIEVAGDAAVCGIGLNINPPGAPPAESTAEGPAASLAIWPVSPSCGTRSGPKSRGWPGGASQVPSGPSQDDGHRGIVNSTEATWLAIWNPAVSVASLVPDVLLECERRYDRLRNDPDAVLTEWRARAVTLGQRVRVEGAESFMGIAEDVDTAGALLVRTASGLRRVVAGDVTISGKSSAR